MNPSSARLNLNGNCQRGSPLWRGVNSFVAEVRSKSCRARGHRSELVESLGLPTKAQSPYSPEPIYAGRILKKVRRLVEGRLYGRSEEKAAAISIRWLVAPGRWNRPTAPTKALAHSLSRLASAGRSSTTRFLTREMSSSPVLINTCDVFRFMFQLNEDAEERIEFICKMDLIGRSIAAAVSENLAGPLLRHSALSKQIPAVSLRKLLLNPHVRDGNIPALFADLTQEYGPVFEIRPPFAKPMIILGGPETNCWVHRRGRMYLRTRDYFADFEKVYGASGVLPSLDGADHFRLRKSLGPAYSRGRLEGQLDQLYRHARRYMANWSVGDIFSATSMSRRMINAQISPLSMSVESQDIIDDLMKYKEQSLMTHILKVMPKFMLKTPNMRRRAKSVETLLERVQGVHTSAQRAGNQRDLADDLLSPARERSAVRP